jgi:hypothetical protein
MRDYTKLTTDELLIEKQKLQYSHRQQQTSGKNWKHSHIIDRAYECEYTKIDQELQKRTI